MRCLYCGKELALLKRWTGGGEFCSDAHRQRYQEEYNQLALNRLLQAKPPEKAQNDAPPPVEAKPERPSAVVESFKQAPAFNPPEPAYYAPPAPALAVSAPMFEPATLTAVAQAEPAPTEEPAPAELAGFLVEIPGVALAEVPPMSHPELEFLNAVGAALPGRVIEPLNLQQDPYQLEMAGLVTFELTNSASNYSAGGSRERRLELRDFVRSAPIVEIDLSPVGETGLETSSEAMDILILPQPPQELPVLWQEPPVGFSASATELGGLARLSFETTGFSNVEETREPQRNSTVDLEEPRVEVAAVVPAPHIEEVPEEVLEEVAVAAPVPEPVAEQRVAQTALPRAPIARPISLTVHGVAPGRGKTAQVFSSAAKTAEPQVPRSTALPLRPVMTFGPAPAGAKNEVKSEPKKPAAAPVRPEPRIAIGKEDAKPVKAPVPEPVKEPAALKQVASSPAKAEAKQIEPKYDKKQEAKETVKKEATKSASVMPAPLAAPYPGSNDLGLPQLNLHSSPGFLGQMPAVAKIGIVVVLLAGLGGLIAFSSKSGGAATSSGSGTIVEGSALPTSEAGWITDWGGDPGVRRTRQISILRSSQTLTDYRIEMQGQIESKAIGWVFRAADPKNFYVTKLEIVKPGLEPTVALVRFAIINGEEQAHAQLPLPMKVRLDTMYKIRFDAVGSHFTTYVQDEKVDDWTDDHIKTGGAGFYRERGEDATLKGGMNVIPLVIKK